MANILQILGAAGKGVEGYGIDQRNRVQSALAAKREARDAESDRIRNLLTQRQLDEIGAPPKTLSPGEAVRQADGSYTVPVPRPKPETVSPGEGVRQSDGTYKVELPKEAPDRFSAVPTAGGVAVLNTATGEMKQTGEQNKPTGAGGGLSGAALKTAIAENRAQIKGIDDAIALLTQNPTATGLSRGVGSLPGMGKVGEIVNQKVNPEGNPTRDALGRISSVAIKDISGAAVSGAEWTRLGWVPDAAYDHARNLEKLRAMREYAETKTKEMERSLSGSVPPKSGGAPAASDPEFDALMARYRKP